MTLEASKLGNGVRVVSERMPQVETVSLGIWFDVGARYETSRQNGISHLLEHLAFKGTQSRSARQLAEEIESVGGQMNAYTTREHTTYYARLMKGDLPLAMDILSDIVLNAAIRQVDLEREKDVILQEIGQLQDNPEDLISDRLQAAAYPDQPLGRAILGTRQSVSELKSRAIREYMRRHYRAEATVIAAAGNLEHQHLVELAAAAFGAMSRRPSQDFVPAKFAGGRICNSHDLEQTHLALGFPAASHTDSDYYAQQVFTTILGGSMSSRLFQEVRENRGLAYSIYAFSSAHADTGMLGIYTGTGTEQVPELLRVIAGEIKEMAGGVIETELDRAKAQLKSSLLISLENTLARVEQLGRQMLIFDRAIPIDELIGEVESVSQHDVMRLAARSLEGPKAFAAIGGLGNLPCEDEIDDMFSADA